VIKDVQSGNIGVVNTRLQVPRYDDDKLDASSLILADQIERVPAKKSARTVRAWFFQSPAAP